MILLIGGPSSAGKTNMAQKLLERYHIPYLSLDHLKMGIYRSNRNCGYTPLDSEEKIAEKLWPIVKEMIKTMIENEQNQIIEGCYLLPELVEELMLEYPDDILPVYLIFVEDYIFTHFDSHILTYRSVIENRGEEEDRPVSYFIHEHNKLKEKCIAYQSYYVEIKNNYEAEIEAVYEYIEGNLSNRDLTQVFYKNRRM
ncbi:AAA domain-containing protein [Gracilibacillus ureilyticus]|uniref:AAA domain-containing protein n=1 Tax=Gracilibacillus ureilyticus TaxID=531814 RepID=A0A1H9MQM6_9BACI|nr:2-phosphoglycerate kinase [Gracilibacillus ureilyticus]SER25777.1 AAA domain-containing protein [Gracilibacillus ureilyticus]